MREIKFRAWNKLCDCRQCVNIPFERLLQTRYGSGECFLEDEDLVVEQSTGLNDKNGKEIYEGDIMHWPDHVGKDYYKPWLVEWLSESASYTNWSPKGKAEVIGNIHENPELLEG